MAKENLETVRTYYRASEIFDWATARECLAPAYQWVDHGMGAVARTPEELERAKLDASAYTKIRYNIDTTLGTSDSNTIVVQGRQECTFATSWRGLPAAGKSVHFSFCAIFRFDGDGLIVHEDKYYDMYSVRQQLGC